MAEKIIIDLEVRNKKGVKEVEKLNKSLEKVKDKASEVNNEVAGVGDSAKKGAKGLGKIKVAFKAIGTAIKAAGIGFVILAVAKIGEAFQRNQKFLDAFNVAMEAISIVTDDLQMLVKVLAKYLKEILKVLLMILASLLKM